MTNESAYVVYLKEEGVDYYYQNYRNKIYPATLHDLYMASKLAEEESAENAQAAESEETELDNTVVSTAISKKQKKETHKKFSDIFVESTTDALTQVDAFIPNTIHAIYFNGNSPVFTLIEDKNTHDFWFSVTSKPEKEDIEVVKEFIENVSCFNKGKVTLTTRQNEAESAIKESGLNFLRVKPRADPTTTWYYDISKNQF